MTPQIEALMRELAPALEQRIVAEVERVVQAKIAARELVVPVWRGRWMAGMLCGEASLVEHHGRLWLATTATRREPGASSRDWTLHADRDH